MKNYKVSYNGNSSRFTDFNEEIFANSEREAVIGVYRDWMDGNYFPQEDGTIEDCDGHEIASATSDSIEYDGGCFFAEEIFAEIYN